MEELLQHVPNQQNQIHRFHLYVMLHDVAWSTRIMMVMGTKHIWTPKIFGAATLCLLTTTPLCLEVDKIRCPRLKVCEPHHDNWHRSRHHTFKLLESNISAPHIRLCSYCWKCTALFGQPNQSLSHLNQSLQNICSPDVDGQNFSVVLVVALVVVVLAVVVVVLVVLAIVPSVDHLVSVVEEELLVVDALSVSSGGTLIVVVLEMEQEAY